MEQHIFADSPEIQTLIGELHPALRWAAREPYGAQALVFALLLDRDAAIRKACHEFGYTQAEVAAATGLHYSSVSKILRKWDNSRFKI